MNTRQTVLSLASAVLLACAGSALAIGCSSNNNPAPPPANVADASAADSSTVVDGTAPVEASTASDSSSDAPSTITDAGTGCTPDASNPLLGCAALNVTCVPFTADVPDAPPL
jgi:hypothetical protein